MARLTRRSVIRGSIGLVAAGTLARPYIANAQAKTAEVWWPQGFVPEEDTAIKKIAADYEKMFSVLRSLHCDIFLGAHGNYYDMETKYARMNRDANQFIDPEGYKKYVNEREQVFRAELAHQQAGPPR